MCSLALIKGTDTPRSIPVALGLMIVPVVDTTLVFITRRRDGRSFMEGGVDHLHHRFGRTGLGPRGGAAVLASVAAVGAAIAILVASDYVHWLPALVAVGCIGLILLLIGMHLNAYPTNVQHESSDSSSV